MVVKIKIDADGMPQPSITDKPEAMQAFAFERTKEALDVRIAVGCPRRDAHDLDTSGTQGRHPIPVCRIHRRRRGVLDQVRDAMLQEKAGIGIMRNLTAYRLASPQVYP